MAFFYKDDLDDSEKEEILKEKEEEQEQYIQEQYDKGIIPDYRNKNNNRNFGNGNGKADSSQQQQQQEQSITIQSPDYIEYVIRTIKKTVRCEDSLIRHILYTALSTYIPDKTTNLGILAPTSEGKTYAVTETLQYFPKEDVEIVGKMSTMALVRDKGILIDKNGEPIGNQIKELIKRKSLLGNKKEDKEEKIEINEEIQELLDGSKTLIDLSGKILVFLESPRQELWDLLKPILSHDKKEIKFDFVNHTDREGHQTKKVIVRGWPACIFCSAKDESKWEIWSEIKSRFSIASPNMIPKKYDESTQLIALNFGWPDSVQQHAIISDNDMELAKDCILLLKQTILKLQTKNNNSNKIPLWIPYNRLLQKQLPSNKGTDVRLQKRIFSLLNVIPIVKSNLRKTLVLGNEKSVIADISDLKEVLSIIQNFDGIPKFKSDFFINIFCTLYRTKTQPDESADGSKKEDRIAVTSKQLAVYYKEKTGKTISTDNIKSTYLNELVKNGLIDYEVSKIHAKQYIYHPLVDPFVTNSEEDKNSNNSDKSSSTFSSITDPLDQVSQESTNIFEKIINKMDETWLFYEIMVLLSHRVDLVDLTQIHGPLADYLNNHTEFKILQEENDPTESIQAEDNINRLTIRQFTKNYIDQKSHISINEKKAPNNASFGKISPLSSIQAKIDEKDEKSNTTKTLFNNSLISDSDLKDPNGFQYEPEIINNIRKSSPYSDRWFCLNCTLRDDKWGMMKHQCKHNKRK